MNRLPALVLLGMLSISVVLAAAPSASAGGGWNCRGDPAVAQVCVAKTISTGPDCVAKYTALGHAGEEFCIA
jgi:hypothetical protein